MYSSPKHNQDCVNRFEKSVVFDKTQKMSDNNISVSNEASKDQQSASYNHGLGLKVSNKDSMAGWTKERINKNESFDDFIPFLRNWLTIDVVEKDVHQLREDEDHVKEDVWKGKGLLIVIQMTPLCQVNQIDDHR